MIKNEFKIGNYITIKNNEFDENPKSIIDDDKKYKIINIIDEYAILEDDKKINITNLNPIKISLPMFNEFRQFKLHTELPTQDFYLSDENVHINPINLCVNKNCNIISNIEIECVKVEYLHQLQNEFHKITGKELVC